MHHLLTVCFAIGLSCHTLARPQSISPSSETDQQKETASHSNVTAPTIDVHCYPGELQTAYRADEDACASSINYIITRDGAAEFERRQPFYKGPNRIAGLHRVPDNWVGRLRQPRPCQVKLTVLEFAGKTEYYDFFTLKDVATVAQAILQKCVRDRPYLKLGGEARVGNDRDFIVAVNGMLGGEVGGGINVTGTTMPVSLQSVGTS